MPNPNLPINYRKNTYIGARYVPKFSDTPGSEWDNSIQYEPLTIVLYQGNSYTSKTFVPTGVDITNDTYWAPTGNFNAQLAGYIKEVKLLKLYTSYDVKMYGAKGDGNTDDSAAVQQALDNNALIYFSPGTYVLQNLKLRHDTIIVGSAKIKPVFIDGIAQNVITSNSFNLEMSGIEFIGQLTGITNYSVYRQSLIFVNNANHCKLSNLKYSFVTDTLLEIELNFSERMGDFLTIRDVNYTSLNEIIIDGCKKEEVIWIQTLHKPITDIHVSVNGFYSYNCLGLSLLDVIANDIVIERAYSDPSDNGNRFSWCNLFCKKIVMRDSQILGNWEIAFDNNEDNRNMSDEVIIENCVFKNQPISCDIQAMRTLINGCSFEGSVTIRNAVSATDPNFNYQYLELKQTEYATISNCKLKYFQRRLASILFSGSKHGMVYVENNIFDFEGATKGSAVSVGMGAGLIAKNNSIYNLPAQGAESSSQYAFDYASIERDLFTGICIAKDNSFYPSMPSFELYLASNVRLLECDNNLLVGNFGVYELRGKTSNSIPPNLVSNNKFKWLGSPFSGFKTREIIAGRTGIVLISSDGTFSNETLEGKSSVSRGHTYSTTGGYVTALESKAISSTDFNATGLKPGTLVTIGGVKFFVTFPNLSNITQFSPVVN